VGLPPLALGGAPERMRHDLRLVGTENRSKGELTHDRGASGDDNLGVH
jgi:hypothetical protein